MRHPRPVSPLSYEPIVPSAEDIVYENTSSSDEDEEQRQAKRRRIEEYGTRYRQGRPVYIMTAHLRGPFEKPWQNPWQKKKKTERSGSTLEKVTKQGPAISKVWRDAHRSERLPKGRLNEAHDARIAKERISDDDRIQGEDILKHSWLRKDRSFSTSDNDGSQRSPTPAKRADDKQRLITHFEANVQHEITSALREPSGQSALLSDDSKLPSTEVDMNVDKERPSARNAQRSKQARKPRRMNFASSPVIFVRPKHFGDLQQTNQTCDFQAKDPGHGFGVKPPDVTLSGETSVSVRSLQIDPVTNVTLDESDKAEDKTSGNEDGAVVQPQQPHEENLHEQQRQLRSVNNSNTTAAATNAVPSAQIELPPAQLQSETTSSIVSIQITREGMDVGKSETSLPVIAGGDSILGLSTQAPDVRAQEKRLTGLTSADSSRPAAEEQQPAEDEERKKDGIKLFRSLNSPSSSNAILQAKSSSSEKINTQALLGAITPFAIDTVKAKPFTDVINKSPVTFPKPRQKKRASFAPTSQDSNISSTSSIKSCLRVTKPVNRLRHVKMADNDDSKGINADKEWEEGRGNLQPYYSQQNESYMRAPGANIPTIDVPRANPSRNPLQDIAHTNGLQMSSTAPFTPSNTTHTSEVHPEAQPISKPPSMSDDPLEAFDLSAAMDDVGSFLQGWDTEKESRNLSKTCG